MALLVKGSISLETVAKSAGGDKYKGTEGALIKLDNVYIPQSFSRKNGGAPAKNLSLSVYDAAPSKGDHNDHILLKLAKAAKKGGGDKYEGEYEGSKITLYFPQDISRFNGAVGIPIHTYLHTYIYTYTHIPIHTYTRIP
jgi:hypothetical protein